MDVNKIENKTCSFDGCNRLMRTKDLCGGHYEQQRRGAELTPLRSYSAPEFCTFDGCGRKHKAKGLCVGHWTQQYEGKELLPIGWRQKRKCMVDGCDSKHDSYGYCKRHSDIATRYNIDPALYESMITKECQICGRTDSGDFPRGFWAIDHDHSCCSQGGKSCGKCVRGVICVQCNSGLGHFMDNPDVLLAAAAYLISHKNRSNDYEPEFT